MPAQRALSARAKHDRARWRIEAARDAQFCRELELPLRQDSLARHRLQRC